ncbi:T9SS C-terminal target domain-containing protein [Rhodohalobacter sp. SW132]|uniref:T9SS type A sorting domain-containing protein n=1 Tax=Rhodohalobacter sp. SW132 TaxID=2293433 RepID=UPI000E2322FC|nr:T9SS type A sorting domain-containing protein [Rhodohalobacter sp. SW132]REL33502.1 T9SS C-terminal target domain-containing protein [Rhodohalobacter sp. SW132]
MKISLQLLSTFFILILSVAFASSTVAQDAENVIFYIDDSGDGAVKSIRSYHPDLDSTTTIINNSVSYRHGHYNALNDSLVLIENRRVFKASRDFSSFEELNSLSNSFLTIKTEFDSENGVLYFTSNAQVQAMDLETETISTEIMANNNVFGLAMDAAGTMFWAESDGLGETELMSRPAESEDSDTLYVYSSTGFGTFEHLISDAAGENLYFVVDESFSQKLYHIDTETATLTELFSSSQTIYQIILDEDNNRLLMLTSEDRSSIYELDLAAESGTPEAVYSGSDRISNMIFDDQQNSLILRYNFTVNEWTIGDANTVFLTVPSFFGGVFAVDADAGWIYFITEASSHQVMRSNFTGSDISVVKDLSVFGTLFRRIELDPVTNDLYMIDSRRLYRTNLNDEEAEETLISLDAGNSIRGLELDIEGERIFLYMEGDGIYKTDLDGANLEAVTTEGFYTDSGIAYNPDRDEVYYSNSTRIWAVNSDGSDRETIQEFFTGVVTDIEYNAVRQQIFFIDRNAAGDDALRYMSVDPEDDTYEILFTAKSITAFAAILGEDDNVDTSVDRIEDGTERPMATQLQQNYPNPFNPTTVIGYDVAERATVSIDVYDMTGRKVATLVNSQQAPGSYQVNFDGSNLASGMYLYRLTAGQITQTRKLMLVK